MAHPSTHNTSNTTEVFKYLKDRCSASYLFISINIAIHLVIHGNCTCIIMVKTAEVNDNRLKGIYSDQTKSYNRQVGLLTPLLQGGAAHVFQTSTKFCFIMHHWRHATAR